MKKDLELLSGWKVDKKVKYLGLWLTTKNPNIFQDNYGKKFKNDLEIWDRMTSGLKLTACYDLKENYMNMIYRCYLTPSKLAKMYKSESSKC